MLQSIGLQRVRHDLVTEQQYFLEELMGKISILSILWVIKIITVPQYIIGYYILFVLYHWTVILFMWIDVETFALGLPRSEHRLGWQLFIAVIEKTVTEIGLRDGCSYHLLKQKA